MNYKDGGFVQMSGAAREDGSDVAHEKLSHEFIADELGYVYIYLSNDGIAGSVEAYFDDFEINSSESYIVQTIDYYPYGLVSSNWKREGHKATKDLFQGKTYEELTQWSDFYAKQYDAALGRWFGVDPQGALMPYNSPYVGMMNNPLLYVDPDGELPILVFAVAAVIGGGMNMWSNADNIKGWKSGLAYFTSGALGGAVSVVNPALGGSITAGANVGIDLATGNLPDFSNPIDAAKYVGLKALEGIGTAGVGSLSKAGISGIQSIGNAAGWLQSFASIGQTTGSMAGGYLLPQATFTLTRVPASQMAANAARIAGKAAANFADDAAKGATKLLTQGEKALHNHHVMPQQFRKWFSSRGISNIDDYAVQVSQSSHLKGIHGKGLGNLPGQWNKLWGDFIKANPNATPSQIFHHAEGLLQKFGLEHLPYLPY